MLDWFTLPMLLTYDRASQWTVIVVVSIVMAVFAP